MTTQTMHLAHQDSSLVSKESSSLRYVEHHYTLQCVVAQDIARSDIAGALDQTTSKSLLTRR